MKYKAVAIREFLCGFPDGNASKSTEAVEVIVEFPNDTKNITGETSIYSHYGNWILANLQEPPDA